MSSNQSIKAKIIISKQLYKPILTMQQKINPEQDLSPQKNQTFRRVLVRKCKGKPFWLSIDQSNKDLYQKYKRPQQQKQSIKQTLNSFFQEKSKQQSQNDYLESISSDNQTYDMHFESYQLAEPQKSEKKSKNNCTPLVNNKKQMQKIKKQVHQSLFSSPKISSQKRLCDSQVRGKRNQFSLLSGSKGAKSRHKKCKTQISEQKYCQDCVFQQSLLHRKIQRLLQQVQQMRKLLPQLSHNIKQLQKQQKTMKQLKKKTRKATSTDYSIQLDCLSSNLSLKNKKVKMKLEQLNSPYSKRNIFHKMKVIVDKLGEKNSLVEKYQMTRQQLLHKMRLAYLQEYKLNKLNEKIQIYSRYLSKVSLKYRQDSIQMLDHRRYFLEWDLSRTKNNFDLESIEIQLKNKQLKEEIKIVDSKILCIGKNSQCNGKQKIIKLIQLCDPTAQKDQSGQNNIVSSQKSRKLYKLPQKKY